MVDVYRYCAVVGGLLGWTEYLVGVRAWAGLEMSVAATPVKTATTSDCEYYKYVYFVSNLFVSVRCAALRKKIMISIAISFTCNFIFSKHSIYLE